MTRRIHALRSPVAAMVAMVPGFLLPFAVTLKLPTSEADAYLLAMSVTVTLANVVGVAIELNTAAEIGRLEGVGGSPGVRELRIYRNRVLVFAGLAIATVGPLTIGLYTVRSSGDAPDFLWLAALALGVPVLGAFASIRSGILIATGRAHWAVALQAPRTIVPLCVVLTVPQAPPWIIVLSLVLGESIRLISVHALTFRWLSTQHVEAGQMLTNGLWWQAGSAAVSQGSGVIDRAFLAAVPGGVSAYELADKVYFAAMQFLNLGYLVPKVGEWVRLPSMRPSRGRALLRSDLMKLAVLSVLLSGSAAAFALGAYHAPWIPESWREAMIWVAILSMALPASAGIAAGGRLLIVARRQRLLLWFSLGTLLLNAAGDLLLFALLGPVGIPVATVIVRTISVGAYAVVVARILRDVLGVDWEEESTDGRN